jgi:predicted 3-demethylubiquinone-9 3-methyltransferase (glyoxalase superfamily)
MSRITPCLWFDTQAEEAAQYYTSIFDDSRIVETSYYTENSPRTAGMVMTVLIEIEGQRFLLLNGGPEFHFSEAISFQVPCADQAEIDRLWDALTANGGEESECGWLKDRYGVSWQIFPERLPELLSSDDPAVAQSAMTAMLGMRKIDLAAIENARLAATSA